MEPTSIEYIELKQITDDFAERQIIGEGGYGKVYWVRASLINSLAYPASVKLDKIMLQQARQFHLQNTKPVKKILVWSDVVVAS